MISPIVELTQKFINIKSVSKEFTQLHEVISVVKQEMADSQLKLTVLEHQGYPSLFISINGSPQVDILLNGHLDVVEADESQFQPFIKEGKLYGRGSYDMKAACAAFIVLMKQLAKEKPKSSVGLLLVTDEETSGEHGTLYSIEQGYKANFVITGEPSDLMIRYQSKGVLCLNVTTAGKAAHGSRVWEGNNAIIKMNQYISKLLEIYPLPNQEQWVTTVNMGRIKAGNSLNVVPASCELGLDIRYIPEDNPHDIIARVKKLFADAQVEVLYCEPPIDNDRENAYLKRLKKAVTETVGQTRFYQGHGSSDARYYTARGIPAVAFGPRGANLHGKDEYVEIESLQLFYDSLYNFIHNFKV